MKNRKLTIIIVGCIVAFATLLCLYSSKISKNTVMAIKISPSKAQISETVNDNSADSQEETDEDEQIDPDIILKPDHPGLPRIGKRKPGDKLPDIPRKDRKKS